MGVNYDRYHDRYIRNYEYSKIQNYRNKSVTELWIIKNQYKIIMTYSNKLNHKSHQCIVINVT